MTKRKMFHLRPHIVCILDVLGQKERLAEWANVDVQDATASMPAIKKTAGTMVKLEDMVSDFLAAFQQPTEYSSKIASLPKAKQEVAARFNDCTLGTQQFADTLIFYAPTANSFGDVSSTALYRILTGCATVMLMCLAARVPMRGGVSVGWGTELAEHNFYGPALGEAHLLEETIAEYPRVAVSESVLRFIRTIQKCSGNDDIGRIMRALAGHCQALICEDSDGHMMVDFLGEGFRNVIGDADPETVDAIGKAYGFVFSEAHRFKEAGNHKLAGRYERLRHYIESRLRLWGIEAGK